MVLDSSGSGDGLRGRNLSVANVARTVASWPCFRSLRLAGVGSSNDQGNSISPKGAAAGPLTQALFYLVAKSDESLPVLDMDGYDVYQELTKVACLQRCGIAVE